jgi:hypothetical protein
MSLDSLEISMGIENARIEENDCGCGAKHPPMCWMCASDKYIVKTITGEYFCLGCLFNEIASLDAS